jgi:hypothetical protein
VLVIAGSIVLL